MGKKLNVTAVNSAAKKAYSMKRFHLEDNQGEVWDVDIDVMMDPNRVIDMVQNVIMLSAKIADEDMSEVFDLEKHWTLLYFIEILKNYTNVEIKEKKTAEETVIDYVTLFNSLGALGLVEKITDCFNENARRNTLERFTETLTQMSEFIVEETERVVAEAEEVDVKAEEVAE